MTGESAISKVEKSTIEVIWGKKLTEKLKSHKLETLSINETYDGFGKRLEGNCMFSLSTPLLMWQIFRMNYC
jgi:hypothetical protein